jgi:Tfp pilus assembly protein PilO
MKLASLRRRFRGRDGMALTAAVIGLATLVFQLAVVLPLESRVQHKRAAIAQAQQQAGPRDAPAETGSPSAQLAAFYAQLPPAAEAQDMVRRLHLHAHDAGLEFDRGEYRPPATTTRGLLRYQVVLPVTGTYPQVRRFLAAAMRDMPSLALDAIDFRRGDGATARIEAQLRFTGFMRAGA